MSIMYSSSVNYQEVEWRKNQQAFMDSNFCQMQMQQQQQQPPQQQQQSSGLTRYHSAPSSLLASFLDNNGGGGGGGSDDYRYVRASSPEIDPMLSRYISECNGPDHHYGSNGLHQFADRSVMKQEAEESAPEQNKYSNGSTHMMYLNEDQQVHAMHSHNSMDAAVPVGSALDSNYGVINSAEFEDSLQAKMGSGSRSNLVRQSSSPAGFFSDLTADNSFAAMRGVASFRAYKEEPNPPTCTLSNQINFSSGSPSYSRPMPQIAESENEKMGLSSSEGGQSLENADFTNGSWDDSAFHSLKRARDDDGNMFSTSIASESQNADFRNRSHNLTHHLSLPKSFEMGTVQKYLQFQGSAPCKIRAKRGFATHPRSIAERVRRTRISERMRKLQDLFPNMDKQTNTADMLDLAVEYIKDLQKQVKTLNDTKSRCSCSNTNKQYLNASK